eukprot:1521373-Rhodomonas_salina.2
MSASTTRSQCPLYVCVKYDKRPSVPYMSQCPLWVCVEYNEVPMPLICLPPYMSVCAPVCVMRRVVRPGGPNPAAFGSLRPNLAVYARIWRQRRTDLAGFVQFAMCEKAKLLELLQVPLALRGCYTLSGTDIAYGPVLVQRMVLLPYAMSGTESACSPTRCLVLT